MAGRADGRRARSGSRRAGKGAERTSAGSAPAVVRAVPDVQGPWQVLAGGEMTASKVIFGEALIPPHTPSPSLHLHTREDEAAYVVEGVLSCRVGEDRFDAAAGSLVWLQREVPHTFA